MMIVEPVKKSDHMKLIQIWEQSVRATHDFLKEDDLQQLKPLIFLKYFDLVGLTCVKNNEGEIQAFCGVLDGKLEMLFVSPTARGKGLGSLLVRHAIALSGVTMVDVNEQNHKAVGFYKYIGFSVVGRSALDGQGKPYPLLHMALQD